MIFRRFLLTLSSFFRQFKEQLRAQRQSESTYQQQQQQQQQGRLQGVVPSNGHNNSDMHHSNSDSRISKTNAANKHNTRLQAVSSTGELNGAKKSGMPDGKTMQKEAVLSYVKSKTTASPGGSPSHHAHYADSSVTASPLRHRTNGLGTTSGRSGSTSSIPQPSSQSGRLNGSGYAARRDMEKAASADAHINQLRMVNSDILDLTTCNLLIYYRI